jgi:hypothetical protein
MDNRHTGNCDPCRIKDENVAAHYFCQTCVEYFCHQCSDKHLKELISKGHLVKVWKKDKLHYLPVTNFGKDNNCQQYSEHFKNSTSGKKISVLSINYKWFPHYVCRYPYLNYFTTLKYKTGHNFIL